MKMSNPVADDLESQLPNMDDYHQHEISGPVPGSDDTISDEVEYDTILNAVAVEPEQDSIRSCVEETQFVDIEIDTQAPEKTSFVIAQQSNNSTLPSDSTADGPSFIPLPEPYVADEINCGFTFGKAPQTKIGQFSGRPQNNLAAPVQHGEGGITQNKAIEKSSVSLGDTAFKATTIDSNHNHQNFAPIHRVETGPSLADNPTESRYRPATFATLNRPNIGASLPTRGGAIIIQTHKSPPRTSVSLRQQGRVSILGNASVAPLRKPTQMSEQPQPPGQTSKPVASHSSRLRSGPRIMRRSLPETFSGGLLRTLKPLTRPFPEVQSEPHQFQHSSTSPPNLHKSIQNHDNQSFSDLFHPGSNEPQISSKPTTYANTLAQTRDKDPSAEGLKSHVLQDDNHREDYQHVEFRDFSASTQITPQAISPSPPRATSDIPCSPHTPRPQSCSNTSAFRVRAPNIADQQAGDTGNASILDYVPLYDQWNNITQQPVNYTKNSASSPQGSCRNLPAVLANLEGSSITNSMAVSQGLRLSIADKVVKPVHTKFRQTKNVTDPPQRTKPSKLPLSPSAKSCQKYIQACKVLFETHDYNVERIKIQEAEIEKLKRSNDERVKKLEEDNSALRKKVEKYIKFGATYTEHMNKVVNSQKALKIESGKLRDTSTKAIEAFAGRALAAEKIKDSADKIQNSLKEIKAIRLEVDKAVVDERSLRLARQIAEKSNEKVQELEKRLEELSKKDKETSEKLAEGTQRGTYHI
jgi:hypothetical protein